MVATPTIQPNSTITGPPVGRKLGRRPCGGRGPTLYP